MTKVKRMLEEIEEGFISTDDIADHLREREGPTSKDVTDRQISIEEVPIAEPPDEKLREQIRETKVSKKKQKKRTISYLADITKQVEKDGFQINRVMMLIQSLQKQKQGQKQSKSAMGAGISHSQSKFLKQIQSQVTLLQKQVARIQKDVQRIRAAPAAKTKANRKPRIEANVKSKSKKSKSSKNIKDKKKKQKKRSNKIR